VLELPISLSDLYDPIPYQQSPRHKQVRRRVKWISNGRLHRAMHEGNMFTFRTLLSLGADPEETVGDCPLLAYAAKGSVGTVFCSLLLDRGVHVDTRDSSGNTPLWHSIRRPGCDDICKLLLDRGAAIDLVVPSDCTLLSLLIQFDGNDFACSLLFDRGAAVDSPDSNGRTPLSHCAELGNATISKLLLDRGASTDSTDSDGCTPLVCSVRMPLAHATPQWERCAGTCELLLNRGATVDAAGSSRRTPLSYCPELGNLSLCRLLLDRGAAVD